jgi:hypothetical protein
MKSFSTQGHLNDHVRKHNEGKIVKDQQDNDDEDSEQSEDESQNVRLPIEESNFKGLPKEKGG